MFSQLVWFVLVTETVVGESQELPCVNLPDYGDSGRESQKLPSVNLLGLPSHFQINNMKTKFKETIEKCDSLELRLSDLLKEKQSVERK